MITAKHMILRLMFAALLLFAQQVAGVHQTQHALDHGPIQLQHAGDDSFRSDLCAYHSDFESLLSAVGSAPSALYLSSTAFEQVSAALSRYYPAKHVIPASRGPPYVSSPQSQVIAA